MNTELLWFASLQREWSTLALVPCQAGVSALETARSLATVGTLHLGRPLLLLSGEGRDLAGASRIAVELRAARARAEQSSSDAPEQVIVATDAVLQAPEALAIVTAADAAILCVELGKTSLDDVRRTAELIGPDRVLGCALLPPQGGSP
jgi:hypothetical protein